MNNQASLSKQQSQRNQWLLEQTPFLGERFNSSVLPFTLDFNSGSFSDNDQHVLSALGKRAAAIAIRSLSSLAKVNDIDHLGGGLDLIPALMMTLLGTDYDKRHFTIEHAHTSIGYYAALAALGFLSEDRVEHGFRRSLDIAGHVSWVPGGTQMNGGRLGVMVPMAVGMAIGLREKKGSDSAVTIHCGDAGWISGQALNGLIAASLHRAPIVMVMHRNGIQLSGTTERIMNKDPRPIIESLGIHVLEIPSLHDTKGLFFAYVEAYRLATSGKPVMIYPTGYGSSVAKKVTLTTLGEQHGIAAEVAGFAAKNGVTMDQEIWIPGSLMSFRDVHAMLECVFYVNNLPGGEGHHDGGMKGRIVDEVLENPMLKLTAEENAALKALASKPRRVVTTIARPAKDSPNLVVEDFAKAAIKLPGTEKWVSARVGSEAAYALVARAHPTSCFFVSCDLDPSTKMGKAAALVPPGHRVEMSIQEQAAAILANGLSMSTREPQLTVFATFTAFIEGIAREGFELWRYQRNLTGTNEGLNVVMHLSHVGACTGRDHFSGWSLDWVNLALGYLPFLRRFYAPCDAHSAFVAVIDAAAAFGGHIVAIPRDNLPVLTRQDSKDPLWAGTDPWTSTTIARTYTGAKALVVALGAPAFLAVEAAEASAAKGCPADVVVVNGFPVDPDLSALCSKYEKVITIEDGLIGTPTAGLRGFAAYVASQLRGSGPALMHFGIIDPSIAPSEYFIDVWNHFGMNKESLMSAIQGSASTSFPF